MPAAVGRQVRVSEAIVHRIKKQITEGRLLAGHKLPAEREMARQFRTSRVSVREAYRSLEEVGVLRIRRGADGGAFIAQLDHEPVLRSLSLVLGLGKTPHKELTEARMLIEPPIARLAATSSASSASCCRRRPRPCGERGRSVLRPRVFIDPWPTARATCRSSS